MASLSDILSTVQQGVVAVNNLVTQVSGSFLNISGQLTAINGPWTGYTPVVTPQGGSFAGATIVASGKFKQIGKTIFQQADVLLTALGSGVPSGGLRISLPFTATNTNFAGTSREIALTGVSGSANVIAGSSQLDARTATGATYISTGNQVITGVVYEIP